MSVAVEAPSFDAAPPVGEDKRLAPGDAGRLSPRWRLQS